MYNQFLAIAIAFTIGLTGELVLSLPPNRLSDREISQQLQTIPSWQLRDGRIEKTFKFNNFIEAIAFVNRLVNAAESLGHHPDIIINYNRVTLSLTTHDVGGLSNLDFDLAQQIDRLTP
jgi:4a-hydroxytetrahydrobiopterin dehydratase